MPSGRTISGSGQLIFPGGQGQVRYELQVPIGNSDMSAGGSLAGEHDLLDRALQLNPHAKLELASGRQIDIAITQVISGQARFMALSDVTEGVDEARLK